MSETTVTLDDREFLQAMKEYGEASGRDFALAVNLKTRDAAYKAQQAMRVADAASIRAVVRNPKVIAWHLRRRRRSGGVDSRGRPRSYSRDEAQLYGWAVLRQRLRARNSGKAFFFALIRSIEFACPDLPGKALSKANRKTGHHVSFTPADPYRTNPLASGSVVWSYKYSKGGQKFDDMLENAWGVGVGKVLADTQRYLEGKMKQRAAQYSAAISAVGNL